MTGVLTAKQEHGKPPALLRRRYKSQIKQSISEAINKRSVTDVDSGESVSIPTDDISEPMFHQGRGGLRHRVHPVTTILCRMTALNAHRAAVAVQEADKAKPAWDGEGQDEFVFQISKDEYLDLLFEDLALPNLKQNQQRQLTEYKTHRAGFTSNGVCLPTSAWCDPAKLTGARTAMTAGKRRELHASKRIWKPSRKANQHSCWKRNGYAKRLPNYGQNRTRAIYRHL